MKRLREVAGGLAFAGVLGVVALALTGQPRVPELTVEPRRPQPCTPSSRFTSSAPPALPGEWQGNRGFFAIPGTLDLQFCRSGRLSFQARGEVADNGGGPLLVMRTDAGQQEALVTVQQRFQLQVGPSGRATLAFPNDETNAAYRILVIERLVVAGQRQCGSTLVRQGVRQTFDRVVTGAIYDREGQVLEPCQSGKMYLTVSGTEVEGAGPRLRVTQGGRLLLDQEVVGRASLTLPLADTRPVRLSVENFLGRTVKYRNLFIDELEFQPGS